MCDIQKKMKNVYYYDGYLFYQVKSEDKMNLLKDNGSLKNFIVLNITKGTIQTKDEYISELTDLTPIQIINSLDHIKFKVYRKIKLKEQMTYYLLYDNKRKCSVRTTSEFRANFLVQNYELVIVAKLVGFDMRSINQKTFNNTTSRKYLKLYGEKS